MPPNANMNPRPSGPYTQSNASYESQFDGVAQGVVASHSLAQGRETWIDFIRERDGTGSDPTANRLPPTPSNACTPSTPATAPEGRPTPSPSRYTLPNRPSSRNTDSSSSRSSDRKRRLTTADSPMRRPSSSRMHSENVGDTSADPIVLDSSPAASMRALPPTPSLPPQANTGPPGEVRRQSDIVLPAWQPDGEVAQCPVCGRHFTFLFRKHHCRKCGRVVCASCSPHRITIPRQFIVHPPYEGTTNIVDLTAEDENAMSSFGPFRNPALGGGEEVRVCNPCVPDPNFNPPPQYNPASLSQSSSQFPSSSRPPPPPHPRAHRSASSVHDASRTAGQGQTQPPRDPFNASNQARRVSYHGSSHVGERRLPPLPPSAHTQPQHPHHRAPLIAETMVNNRPSHRQRPSNPGYGSLTGANPFGQSVATPVPAPIHSQHAQPPRPRRQVAEEDECPICGNELPPKGPGDDEAERTQHIEECIALHSASPAPVPLMQTTSASLPNQRTRGMSSAGNGEGPSNLNRLSHAARGMFPYTATEKDCTDEEGREAECIICLEDFEAGVKMARLVCWCRFHEKCIKEWWDKKGRGACPTHQLQE
ncbi:hypothetical protein EJ02DRAFT_73550 [Clathrospora elynae]|uniref:RING-type E3 ubiquitin transferase n=1 Tax=Clathrospora elynae TaxID=706981 RepID=A0A6A5SZ71_9PLEO|nr:hypothetical protein EJ02DRAFT_73550 [Clathrospora elynae]